MPGTHNIFLECIDVQIQSKHLLKHDFYLAWSRGELSADCLREYAKDYYQHVKEFSRYISAIHCKTENETTRKILLKNLIEEEAGSPDHPELWKNFALGMGVTEEELIHHKPSKEMENLISTFRHICGHQTIAEGIAALYAYESQIPEICISKIDGLKKYYSASDPKHWEYFTVHIEADREHAAQERELLRSYVNTDNRQIIDSAVNKILNALQNFLSGMCSRFRIMNTCGQPAMPV